MSGAGEVLGVAQNVHKLACELSAETVYPTSDGSFLAASYRLHRLEHALRCDRGGFCCRSLRRPSQSSARKVS